MVGLSPAIDLYIDGLSMGRCVLSIHRVASNGQCSPLQEIPTGSYIYITFSFSYSFDYPRLVRAPGK